VLLAPLLPAVGVEIEIRDPDDTVVVAAAIAAGADAIVTGDQDLLDDEALVAWLRHRGLDVLSPRTLLAALG
jgi:predicted nucleic acid-binding protein